MWKYGNLARGVLGKPFIQVDVLFFEVVKRNKGTFMARLKRYVKKIPKFVFVTYLQNLTSEWEGSTWKISLQDRE